jgi:hypothetical protein
MEMKIDMKLQIRMATLLFVICFVFSPILVLAIDTDRDGLSDADEDYYMTDKENIDTDGDGFSDWVEVLHDYSPHAGSGTRLHEYDYDKDGLNDWLERWFGSEIGKVDTDGDGFSDYEEVMNGLDPTNSVSLKKFYRYIEVNLTLQRLYYFVDGVKIHNFPVSTGNPNTQTPTGEFRIERKADNLRYIGVGYDLPNVMWNMQFKPSYYIHGAYWHNDFGIKTHSHGCVNMKNADAELLYKYVDVGVPMLITGVTPAGYYVR